MNTRIAIQSSRRIVYRATSRTTWQSYRCARRSITSQNTRSIIDSRPLTRTSAFHSTTIRSASSPTADAVMDKLQDLYATAKDEFEIAAEETTKKTVYAQDDRDAAREALTVLQEALQKAVKESDPEVAKEVTSRIGSRVRELENAITAMEESAMEE